MQRQLSRKSVTAESTGALWQPSLGRDLWVEVSAMELLTQETTWEEVVALYHKVYQLKRSPREVPYSVDAAEETHIEILETLKKLLHHR